MDKLNIKTIRSYKKKTDFLLLARPIAGQLMFALFALSLSRASVFGDLSPFGVAFVSAVDAAGLPASLFGAVLGYILSKPSVTALRYIAAVSISAIGSYSLKKVLGQAPPAPYSPAMSFIATLSTGMAVLLTGSVTVANSALYICEAVVAGGAAYFIKKSLEALRAQKSLKYIKPSLLTCILIFFGIILLSLDWLNLAGISLARVAAAFTVMLAARYSKESGGALAGIASGLTLSLSGGAGHIMSGYAAGGMISGLFGQYGRIPTAISFMAINAVCAFSSQDTQTAIFSIAETAIAAIILLLLPRGIQSRAEEFLTPATISVSGESYKNMLRFKLSAAAGTVGKISESIGAASKAIKKLAPPDISAVYDAVQNEVCYGCVRKSSCFEYNCQKTMNAFNDISGVLQTGQKAEKSNAPGNFISGCKNAQALLDSFNDNYNKHTLRMLAEGRASDVRNAAIDQWGSLSLLLENLTSEFSRDIIFNLDTADSARIALESVGVNVTDLFCLIDETGHTLVQAICGPKRKRVTGKAIADAMSDTTGIDFEPPLVSEAEDGKSMLLLCEKTNFGVRTGSSQYIGEGQERCGDAFDFFLDGKGNYIAVLSDGMGTGARAAVDGTMTAGLSSKLIKAGFDYDCVLQTVNSALMVKSKEESLSTLDVLRVNLYTGECSFMKAGASASFIYRDGKTMRIECSSLPLGILSGVEFQRISGKLMDGDILITASDGASHLTKDIISCELMDNIEKSPGELAGILAKKARDSSRGGKVDDISVIVSLFSLREIS